MISLLTECGKNIITHDISVGQPILQLEVSSLSQGMYYYEIETKDGAQARNKFIKE